MAGRVPVERQVGGPCGHRVHCCGRDGGVRFAVVEDQGTLWRLAQVVVDHAPVKGGCGLEIAAVGAGHPSGGASPTETSEKYGALQLVDQDLKVGEGGLEGGGSDRGQTFGETRRVDLGHKVGLHPVK